MCFFSGSKSVLSSQHRIREEASSLGGEGGGGLAVHCIASGKGGLETLEGGRLCRPSANRSPLGMLLAPKRGLGNTTLKKDLTHHTYGPLR